jgi:hypothetical protein
VTIAQRGPKVPNIKSRYNQLKLALLHDCELL